MLRREPTTNNHVTNRLMSQTIQLFVLKSTPIAGAPMAGAVTATLASVITPVVLVTKNSGPLVAVCASGPRVMLSTPRVPDASPDMLWYSSPAPPQICEMSEICRAIVPPNPASTCPAGWRRLQSRARDGLWNAIASETRSRRGEAMLNSPFCPKSVPAPAERSRWRVQAARPAGDASLFGHLKEKPKCR